jgi:hypothetical protein
MQFRIGTAQVFNQKVRSKASLISYGKMMGETKSGGKEERIRPGAGTGNDYSYFP